MSWRYSPVLNDQPSGWYGDYDRSERAKKEASEVVDGDYYVAWVEEHNYSSLMPHARMLLAEMREQFGDATCFDDLTEEEIGMLDQMLRVTTQRWETWLTSGNRDNKQCNAVKVEKIRRYSAGE